MRLTGKLSSISSEFSDSTSSLSAHRGFSGVKSDKPQYFIFSFLRLIRLPGRVPSDSGLNEMVSSSSVGKHHRLEISFSSHHSICNTLRHVSFLGIVSTIMELVYETKSSSNDGNRHKHETSTNLQRLRFILLRSKRLKGAVARSKS